MLKCGQQQQVPRPATSVHLRDRQAAQYMAGLGIRDVQAADLARIDGWHVHRIVFKSAPLRSALEEYNRYSTIPLAAADHSLDNVRISADVRIGDLSSFLRALQETFGIQYRVVGARVELLRTTG